MTPIRCCVIDDEPFAGRLIASYVEKTPTLSLAGVFTSARDAFKLISGGEVDLIFLDIEMPQLSGMEFARLIPDTCRIIFTTAYSRYAVEGYRVNAIDYLMKPVSYEEFTAAVNRAASVILPPPSAAAPQPAVSKTHIIIKSDSRLLQIDLSEILFIEGLKDYVKIYTDETKAPLVTLMQMKNLEQHLPQPPFMRVHRSFIVNTDRIRVIERNRIVFGTHYLPVSDSYRAAFNDFLARRTID